MKIECKLRRKDGTVVEMPGATYHFAPTATDDRHVADVIIEAHIERFLAISEGYGLVRTAGADAAQATFATPAAGIGAPVAAELPVIEGPLKGAEGFEASYTINGRTYVLGEFVAQAFAQSGVTEIEWNELPDETRAIKIEMVMDAVQDGELTLAPPPPPADLGAPPAPIDAPPVPPAPTADPERAALVTAYMAKFGKSPRNMTNATIQAKLAE